MLRHVTTRSLLYGLLLTVAAIAISCGDDSGDGSGASQPTGPSVPMFRVDPAHTGVHPGPGVERSPKVLWRFDAGINAGMASPVVADGVVYSCGAGNLYALDAETGEELWRRGESCYSSLAVVDGVVYTGSRGFDALAPEDGDELWSFLEEFIFVAPPAVVDGVVYLPGGPPEPNSRVCYLFALDAQNGKELWRLEIGGGAGPSSPAIADEIVYVGTVNNDYVYAVNADDGKELWRFDAYGSIFSSPAVVDGVVYCRSYYGEFYALDAKTGKELWTVELQDEVAGSAAVVAGVLYVGDRHNGVAALDASTGEELWRSEVEGSVDGSSPAVVDGVVYVASDADHSSFVYALDTATGKQDDAEAEGVSPLSRL